MEDSATKIEGTTFRELTVDGKTYDHDVVIWLSGEIVKRKKKLSKQLYGTSRVLQETKPNFSLKRAASQSSSTPVNSAMCNSSPEAEAYFAKNGCKAWLNHSRGDPRI